MPITLYVLSAICMESAMLNFYLVGTKYEIPQKCYEEVYVLVYYHLAYAICFHGGLTLIKQS